MSSFLLICFLAGVIGSMLQGMIGIGTGIVIVPLLSFLLPHYGVPATQAMHIALATSMSAIAINSVSALKSHYQRGNIQWRLLKSISFFSLCGAFAGAQLASQLSGLLLRIIFGIFMLALSVYLLIKKPVSDVESGEPDVASRKKMALGGFFIGIVASMVGSGGGVLMVPFLHQLKLKMRYAVGTATLLGFPVAIVGAFTYAFFSTITDPIHWPALITIALAGALGAPLGVKLSASIDSTILLRIFAFVMMLVALKMVVV
jgi:uncharacterized membrane protein YfcA